ncbi:MAG: mannose-phosphate guanylyltransferase [Solirubrobacterales bacterium]|nr:mannose-phosphate guanylyltransferase [Solirubrobacterales bacterium]
MQALILVGGQGTRLRPLTDTIPKPALPLAGRPLIGYMISWLGRHGVTDVVLACGFKAERLRDVLGDGEPGGPALRYLTEPEPRGTAGAIRFAAEMLDERFLALNGDVLADLDLTELIQAHEEHGARATLGLHPVEDSSDYGVVVTAPDGEVTEFREKPESGEAGPGEINAGTYVLERSILELIPPDREVSIEREVFPRLVGDGLYGVRLEGYWLDIGTHERYQQAERDILEGRVKT